MSQIAGYAPDPCPWELGEMRVGEFEDAVLELEHVRIVIRASKNTELGDYGYERKASENTSIVDWLEQRVYPLVGENGVAVVDGSGVSPNRRTKMSTIRSSYTE